MKTCTACHKALPLSAFPKRAASPDGLNTRCFDCKREANRRDYRRDPEAYARRTKVTLDKNRRSPAWNNAWNVWKYTKAIGRNPNLCRFRDTLPFYEEAHRLTTQTGVQHVVDHIVPLRGTYGPPFGFHEPSNLQVITAAENAKKGSKVPRGSK